jgi:hypothetical protein
VILQRGITLWDVVAWMVAAAGKVAVIAGLLYSIVLPSFLFAISMLEEPRAHVLHEVFSAGIHWDVGINFRPMDRISSILPFISAKSQN